MAWKGQAPTQMPHSLHRAACTTAICLNLLPGARSTMVMASKGQSRLQKVQPVHLASMTSAMLARRSLG